MAALDALLRTMLDQGGSDLHLTIGLPPKARISGSLTSIGDQPLDAATMRRTVRRVMEVWQWERAWGWDFPMMAMDDAGPGRL